MLKDLFHSTVDHRTPQLVTVSGVAGVGKSRLSWEFEKYVDGLAEGIWWHRGRCLSYGEGVTYWALADMMRMRVGSVEGEARGCGRREARRDRRRVRRRRRGAAMDRAAAGSAARARRPADDRPGRPVRGLAAVRRADVRQRSGGAGLRGPAVGRHLAAGLRRPSARVVAQPPHLRAGPDPARARRPAPDLGLGSPQLHLAVPRALVPRGHGAAARGPRARPARERDQGDPGPGGGHPALRRRDRPDAARPGPARRRSATSTGRPDRSPTSRCPRPCTA